MTLKTDKGQTIASVTHAMKEEEVVVEEEEFWAKGNPGKNKESIKAIAMNTIKPKPIDFHQFLLRVFLDLLAARAWVAVSRLAFLGLLSDTIKFLHSYK